MAGLVTLNDLLGGLTGVDLNTEVLNLLAQQASSAFIKLDRHQLWRDLLAICLFELTHG